MDMNKVFEAFEELIDKFAEQIMRANKEALTATNKTNAIEYLYKTPQVKLLQQALLKQVSGSQYTNIAIDEAVKPSEAMERVEHILSLFADKVQIETMTLSKCNILTIKSALLKAQEQEKDFDDFLIFKNGKIISSFNYKDKQIVAMPLEEYDELMEQDKVLEIIKNKTVNMQELKNAIFLQNCGKIKNALEKYNQYASIPMYQLTQEEFELLKRYLK